MRHGDWTSNRPVPVVEDLLVVNVNASVAQGQTASRTLGTCVMPFAGNLHADFIARANWSGFNWPRANLSVSTPAPTLWLTQTYLQGGNTQDEQLIGATWTGLSSGTTVTFAVQMEAGGNAGAPDVVWSYVGGTYRAWAT